MPLGPELNQNYRNHQVPVPPDTIPTEHRLRPLAIGDRVIGLLFFVLATLKHFIK